MQGSRKYLTKEEKDVLVLGGIHADGKQYNNADIGRLLDMPVSRVKFVVHQACIKLKAHNRNEAILNALIRGEIKLTELFTLEEIVFRFSTLGSDMLREIADHVRQRPKNRKWKGAPIVCMNRAKDAVLTKTERDVLVYIGAGLSNKEIADKLFVCTSTVRSILYRACLKLGTSRRAEAVILAVRQREISILDICSSDQILKMLLPLGAGYIEKMADLMDEIYEIDEIHEQDFSVVSN